MPGRINWRDGPSARGKEIPNAPEQSGGTDCHQRKTSAKKFRAKLKETKEWLQRERSHLKKGALLRRAKLKLQGHLNYYGITDNGEMCHAFKHQFTRLLYKWLNRQSQRRSYNWVRFNDALAWVGWPSQLIVHQLSPFRSFIADGASRDVTADPE